MNAAEKLLDAGEVAERLNVPVSWVRESTRSGAMPHIRLGRYVRFEAQAVDAWLEQCKQPGRPISFRRRA
jgi:excisionase family DNA binding protein